MLASTTRGSIVLRSTCWATRDGCAPSGCVYDGQVGPHIVNEADDVGQRRVIAALQVLLTWDAEGFADSRQWPRLA